MKNEKLQSLPIGVQDFVKLREKGRIYVDKTERLQEMIESGDWYFLSRPRRFGKSLTLSTLDAMFSGRTELFKGLAAEAWVAEQAEMENPSPVLRFDMSVMNSKDVVGFEKTLVETLQREARRFKLALPSETIEGMTQDLLGNLFEKYGRVVVLIDEYDKPMLDNIGNLELAEAMRQALRSFYTTLKGCDQYLRFVMLTGISKFTKTGVFSAMNNLNDISMDEQYGDIVGYTQAELEGNFSDWIDGVSKKMKLSSEELLTQTADYYDGFCFDGTTRLYNPFSILSFLSKGVFANYWYKSGSPSFIITYMKRHAIQDPAEYAHLEVFEDFADAREIERATPESFLYQSGYLTIKERRGDILVLDYPNYEVRKSIVRMYLDQVYRVKDYASLGSQIWRALSDGNLEETIRLFNIALAGVPYEDFTRQDESLYRSLFLMLLRGAGVTAHGEVPTKLGRSDVLALFPERVVVLEFKLARKKSEIVRLRKEGMKQIEEKKYAEPFDAVERAVTSGVIIIDGKKREAVL